MVHVVKVVNRMRTSCRWSLRHVGPTLNLDSNEFRCFNHRDELNSAVHLPNFKLVAAWHAVVSWVLWCIDCISTMVATHELHDLKETDIALMHVHRLLQVGVPIQTVQCGNQQETSSRAQFS